MKIQFELERMEKFKPTNLTVATGLNNTGKSHLLFQTADDVIKNYFYWTK